MYNYLASSPGHSQLSMLHSEMERVLIALVITIMVDSSVTLLHKNNNKKMHDKKTTT